MPDDKLKPADSSGLADSFAFALRFSGRKRIHEGNQFMAKIAADPIVRHLENSGYVVMKKPPAAGASDNPGRRGSEG
jgi:hypothetical protein